MVLCGFVVACGGGGGRHDAVDARANGGDAAASDAATSDAFAIDAPPADAATVSMTIGSAGGTLTTPGGVTLVIPPGALATDTMITVVYAGNGMGMGTVGDVFELLPDATTFAVPVALTVPYDAARLGGLPENELAVATWSNSQWVTTGWTLVDGARDRATSYITHFSQWAVVPSPSSGGCTVNQACFRQCSGSQVPELCCSAFGTTCRAKLTTSFPQYVRCYSTCVGTPSAANFHNSSCMAGCCTAQGWTVMRQGACYHPNATQSEAQAVVDCARGCFSGSDNTSLCGNGPIFFEPCSWHLTNTPATLGEQCTAQVGDGLNAQLLATELGPVLAQSLGNPALVNVTGGSFDAASISIALTCTNGNPGTGSMTGTWTGQMFTGTWTLGSDSGNFNMARNW